MLKDAFFLQAICYVSHSNLIMEARRQWEEHTNNAIVDYVVVPRLPRDAPIEWHVWAHRHNSRFECIFHQLIVFYIIFVLELLEIFYCR